MGLVCKKCISVYLCIQTHSLCSFFGPRHFAFFSQLFRLLCVIYSKHEPTFCDCDNFPRVSCHFWLKWVLSATQILYYLLCVCFSYLWALKTLQRSDLVQFLSNFGRILFCGLSSVDVLSSWFSFFGSCSFACSQLCFALFVLQLLSYHNARRGLA